MRTSKAQSFLAQKEADLECEVRRIGGELERTNAELRLVRDLQAKLAESPKRVSKKTRLPTSNTEPTATAV